MAATTVQNQALADTTVQNLALETTIDNGNGITTQGGSNLISTLLEISTSSSSTSTTMSTTSTTGSGIINTGLTTSQPPTTTDSGVNMTTIYISAGAAGGTVLLVILIVLFCICCRCGRRKKHEKQQQVGSLQPPPGKRPEPIGNSGSLLKTGSNNNRHEDSTYQRRDPAVYTVDDPPRENSGYQYKPYIVGNQQGRLPIREDPAGIYTITASDGPAPPPFNSLSIPRPTVKSHPSDAGETQNSSRAKYSAANLYGGASKQKEGAVFDTRLDRENSRNDEYKQHNSPQHYTPQPDYSTSPPASPSRNQYYDTGKQPQPPISSDVAFRVHPDYSSRQGSHNENPYDRSIDTMNTSTQQHHAHHIDSNTEQPTDIYSQNKDQIEQRYRQRKQQEEALREKDNRDNITRENRAKSGKYETEITPYMGSTYAISGDFTHIVEPQSPPLSPAAPQVLPKPQSPQRTTAPQPLHYPATPQQHHPPSASNGHTAGKPPRRVPPERVEENEPKNELSSNPVFNKRKDRIAKECKTIRLKDDPNNPSAPTTNGIDRPFVKVDANKTDEEDPYWKIRESRVAITSEANATNNGASPLFNIIPRGNENTRNRGNRNAVVSSGLYEDVIPNNRIQPSLDSDEDYEDTVVPSNNYDRQQLPPAMVRAEAVDDGLTDTARRRLPSMRVSMPPEVLNNAIDDLFEDAIAGSEIDLSIPPQAAPPPPKQLQQSSSNNKPIARSNNNNSQKQPPVLKRKTKLEESKMDELTPKERESWRISRSSFFEEIGANENPDHVITADKEKINAAMVKKGMALRDTNKPFNYMSVQ